MIRCSIVWLMISGNWSRYFLLWVEIRGHYHHLVGKSWLSTNTVLCTYLHKALQLMESVGRSELFPVSEDLSSMAFGLGFLKGWYVVCKYIVSQHHLLSLVNVCNLVSPYLWFVRILFWPVCMLLDIPNYMLQTAVWPLDRILVRRLQCKLCNCTMHTACAIRSGQLRLMQFTRNGKFLIFHLFLFFASKFVVQGYGSCVKIIYWWYLFILCSSLFCW